MGEFFCSICSLHYLSKELADKCHDWCSNHNSCNLSIARRSLEAKKYLIILEKKDKVECKRIGKSIYWWIKIQRKVRV